jgi:hypothetical protein
VEHAAQMGVKIQIKSLVEKKSIFCKTVFYKDVLILLYRVCLPVCPGIKHQGYIHEEILITFCAHQ